MSYCDGSCEHLNTKKHRCELTGEKLTVLKYSGSISYTAHEHSGFCEKDSVNQQESESIGGTNNE